MNLDFISLEDLKGFDQDDIKNHIEKEFEVKLSGSEYFLVAYESEGDFGCDSGNFFLFLKNGKLYENHGSHCSCHGFEGQWEPEETSINFLLSNEHYVHIGGYDESFGENEKIIYEFIENNKDKIIENIIQ